jgi:hypothetical protein
MLPETAIKLSCCETLVTGRKGGAFDHLPRLKLTARVGKCNLVRLKLWDTIARDPYMQEYPSRSVLMS